METYRAIVDLTDKPLENNGPAIEELLKTAPDTRVEAISVVKLLWENRPDVTIPDPWLELGA